VSAAGQPRLCSRIRAARVSVAGISQEEAARRLCLSLKGYRAYEMFREPSLRRLREIAAAFGLDESYFLRDGVVAEVGFEEHVEAELLSLRERVERLERLLREAAARQQRRDGMRSSA